VSDQACRAAGRPLLGVGAVLLTPDLGRVLLIQRGHAPSAGKWSFPGGLVEAGESLRQACQRELAEETGLRVELRDLCTIADRALFGADGSLQYHYVICDFWAVVDEQPVAASSDAADARWVPVEEIAQLPHTRGLPETVQRARQLARGQAPDTLLDE
jgi:8-oxo-dGTP diphosphatase